MTASIANVAQATDSFGQWLAKTNQLITVISNTAVTTNSNTAVGNAAITGTFSSSGLAVSNVGTIIVGTGNSNTIIGNNFLLIQSSSTVNAVITSTGLIVSSTAYYTDTVMTMGNTVVRGANVTADNFVLKNGLRLGNTYLSTMQANTNNIYAANTLWVGDVEANVYIDRNGLQILRNPTATSGFANAKMTNDTLWIKNISANTLTVGSITYTAANTMTFPGNTWFQGQNNYFTYGLTSNANIKVINGDLSMLSGNIGIGIASPARRLDIEHSGTDFQMRIGDAGGYYYDIGRQVADGYLHFYGNQSGATGYVFEGVDGTFARINTLGRMGIGSTAGQLGTTTATLQVKARTTNSDGRIEIAKYIGDAGSPTESNDWPTPALTIRGYGDYTKESMLSFGYSNDDLYKTDNSVWNFRLDGVASAKTSTSSTNLELIGPGTLRLGAGGSSRIDINSSGTYLSGSATITGSSTIQSYLMVGPSITGTPATGEIWAKGNVIAYQSSDERLKENITNIPDALSKVMSLNGVTFDWKNEVIESQGDVDNMFIRKNDVGVIAQDIEKILPQIVTERDDGYKAVKYDRIVALLIEAIKELKAEVDSLKNGN
jgi:hypothetical protein